MQETLEEEEVLRRLGTAEEAGLTETEAARRLRVGGPNVVVLSHHQVRVRALRERLHPSS
jgi:H+-transporting ATPase